MNVQDDSALQTTSAAPAERSARPAVTDPTAGGRAESAAGVTVADLLLLLIIGLGAVMRLSELSALPLSADEARHALALWQVWSGDAAAGVTATSGLYVTLGVLLNGLIGSSDAALRLLPALVGTATIFLPWLLRRRLGTIGALGAALILAFSPTLSATARVAGGPALALFCLLLLAVGWLRYQEGSGQRWLLVAAAALGLGLNSDPLFFGGAVTLGAGVLLQWRYEPTADPIVPPRSAWLRAGAVAGVLFAAGSGFFLLHPTGTALAGWLGQFSVPGDLLTWLAPMLALGRYELLVLLLGSAGLLWITWRGREGVWLFVFWFTAALLIALIQGGTVQNVTLLVLPGALLGGLFLQGVFDRPLDRRLWMVAAAATAVAFGGFVNLARYLRISAGNPDLALHLFLAAAALILVVAGLLYVAGWQPLLSAQAGLLTIMALLLFYTWGTAWWLSHDALNDPRERWVTTGTDLDAWEVVESVEEIANQSIRSGRSADLFLGVDSPVLRWYLRDYEQLQFGSSAPVNATNEMIITAAAEETSFAADYLGTDFALRRVGPGTPGENAGAPGNILRWWLFHTTGQQPEREFVILWVRSDLVTPPAP